MLETQIAKSMTESVYMRLRSDILTCRLKPGSRLKISDLCERVGANLSAVREALARLLADGLVISEPQKGFQVAPVSLKDLHDLTEARFEMDSLCLERSIANGGIEWEARLVSAMHRLSRTPERCEDDPRMLSDDYLRANQEYVEALMSACPNEWLLRIRRQLFEQYSRYRAMSVAVVSSKERDLDLEFRQMTEAALARDVETAIAVLRRQVQLTEHLVSALATSGVGPAKPGARGKAPAKGAVKRRARSGTSKLRRRTSTAA